ncbi:energy transducer TonB [Sinimarinibacterium thermocellulolyticum]|uniref:Energy transducer TonB n=1 Tax=Sinimarinibacterium thermocellulolyticum TaxID=3170016 RepID=A0ABV2A8D1_9GAMM
MSDQGGKAAGLLARIVSSAEYSIAAALLAVCIVVAGALWLLQPEKGELVTAAAPTPSAHLPTVDEDAALTEWKRRLGEQFSEAEQQQRQRAAEEERLRLARAQAEAQAQEELAAARRQAEAERRAQQRLEAAVSGRVASKPSSPSSTPRASAPTPKPAGASSQADARRAPATPTPQPAVVAAAIDWSSCERPSYPALSVRRGEEGTVVIAAELDANARLLDARVIQSSGHSRLDRVTLEAVRACRFTPELENGVARAATAEVRFTWKLN